MSFLSSLLVHSLYFFKKYALRLTYSSSFFKFLVPCSAGTYRPTDQLECVPCEEGTVSTETGATSCTSCDPGKQPNSDKTLCSEYSCNIEDFSENNQGK